MVSWYVVRDRGSLEVDRERVSRGVLPPIQFHPVLRLSRHCLRAGAYHSLRCRPVPPLQEAECFLHVPFCQLCLYRVANALCVCPPIIVEGSPDKTFCPPPLCTRQFPNMPQGRPLSDQGPCLVQDPIIPRPLAQLGFGALCNKTTECLCLFSFLPVGKLKREALSVALVRFESTRAPPPEGSNNRLMV
jgi:hypothetical protein